MSNLPELHHKHVYIVIPVYNDQPVIGQVVRSLLALYRYNIIIVDDGSDVPVSTIVAALPVVCLRHRVNLGQGAALQTGINHALRLGAEVVITFDGDGQHDPADVRTLVAAMYEGHTDVILGSRFMNGSKNNVPWRRRLVLECGRYVNYLLSGILLSDAHNGLRAFNRRSLQMLSITENRMAHASEILFEIRRHRLSYREVPVSVLYSTYSRQKGQSGLNSIHILFELVVHKLFR